MIILRRFLFSDKPTCLLLSIACPKAYAISVSDITITNAERRNRIRDWIMGKKNKTVSLYVIFYPIS